MFLKLCCRLPFEYIASIIINAFYARQFHFTPKRRRLHKNHFIIAMTLMHIQ